jgi:protein-disulfide isomerase
VDTSSGVERKVEKTPTVFIGETAFIEWVPIPELTAAIEAELAR